MIGVVAAVAVAWFLAACFVASVVGRAIRRADDNRPRA